MRRDAPRRAAALLVALGSLLLAGLLLASPASAHATVTSSDPSDGSPLAKAPAAVTVTFDEGVTLGSIGYLHVTDQTGKRVDAGAAVQPGGDQSRIRDTLRSGLGDGTYTASFRVISADSHPVAGTVRFVVGDGALVRGSVSATEGNTATEAVFDVVRWLSFLGIALLGGAWLVLTVWPEGRDDLRARRLLWTGWGAAALGAALELLVQGPYTAGSGPQHLLDPSLIDATLHTEYGQLHSARLLLLGLLALVFARALQADARPARWEFVAPVLAVATVATFSIAGHAGTTAPRLLSVPIDMLHLLAMSTWVGGLALLLRAVLPRREPDELARVLPVFSTVAFWSVAVLAVTGTYSAWRGIGSLEAIFSTTYGLLVVGKIVLFIALLALANLSRKAVRGRSTSDATSDAVSHERLRRAVFVEVLVALVVLALSAVLVAEPRGREALAEQYREPITASASLGSGRSVSVTADPGTHGTVNLAVQVAGGARPTGITATATQIDRNIGPIPVTLTRAGTSGFDGAAPLTVAGRWRLDLVVTTSAFDATTVSVTVELH